MGCRGWPVRGLNDYVEEWTAANSNWTYDGDESFTLYPGYFAAKNTVAGTYAVFNPVVDFLPFPRVPSSPFPVIFLNRVRSICNAGLTVSLAIFTMLSDALYVTDYVIVNFGFDNATGNYFIEVTDQKAGVQTVTMYDTGKARVADGQDDIQMTVSGTGYQIHFNGVLIAYGSGFTFSEIAYMDVNVQRQANKQGMLARTEIYTQAP
jgi:hypothetical protein